MTTTSEAAAAPRASATLRWSQLVIGIICMVMIANLQYGWTFFVPGIQKTFGWDRASIQFAFTLFVLFETVLTERHVGRAADRLNLTPSAVSHGLGRLRQLLNDPLFLRTPKGVVPTARATELAEPIADILARVRRVVATAKSRPLA